MIECPFVRFDTLLFGFITVYNCDKTVIKNKQSYKNFNSIAGVKIA